MGLSTCYFSNVTLISIKKKHPITGVIKCEKKKKKKKKHHNMGFKKCKKKKKKKKKNKELLNLTIKGKAEEGIIRGIIKALYILQDESARSLC